MKFHILVALAIISNSECSPILYKDDGRFSPIECNDITDSLNHLHESLSDHIPLEEKCKKYAVLSSMSSRGRPPNKVLSEYMRFNDQTVNEAFARLTSKNALPALYMSTIDSYRAASHLGPPFLELIDCLREIDQPYISAYLNDPELVLIVKLYKIVLRSPAIKIDLRHNELSHFSPAFRTSLSNLFRGNLLDNLILDEDPNSGLQQSALQSTLGPKDQSIARKNHLKRQAMVTSHRRRERERLRKHRLRLLQPSIEREKRRDRHRRQQEKRKKEHEERQSQSLFGEEWHQSQSSRSESDTLSQQHISLSDSEVNKTDQHLLNLASLWEEAAPVYESIATPIISSDELQERRSLPSSQTPIWPKLSDWDIPRPPAQSSSLYTPSIPGPQQQVPQVHFMGSTSGTQLDTPASPDTFSEIELILQSFRESQDPK